MIKNGVDDSFKEWTGIRYEDLVRLAQDREQWRIMTANLLEETALYNDDNAIKLTSSQNWISLLSTLNLWHYCFIVGSCNIMTTICVYAQYIHSYNSKQGNIEEGIFFLITNAKNNHCK